MERLVENKEPFEVSKQKLGWSPPDRYTPKSFKYLHNRIISQNVVRFTRCRGWSAVWTALKKVTQNLHSIFNVLGMLFP